MVNSQYPMKWQLQVQYTPAVQPTIIGMVVHHSAALYTIHHYIIMLPFYVVLFFVVPLLFIILVQFFYICRMLQVCVAYVRHEFGCCCCLRAVNADKVTDDRGFGHPFKCISVLKFQVLCLWQRTNTHTLQVFPCYIIFCWCCCFIQFGGRLLPEVG